MEDKKMRTQQNVLLSKVNEIKQYLSIPEFDDSEVGMTDDDTNQIRERLDAVLSYIEE